MPRTTCQGVAKMRLSLSRTVSHHRATQKTMTATATRDLLLSRIEGNLHWRTVVHKALVHKLFIGYLATENPSIERQLHQFVKFLTNQTQVSIRDAIWRVTHDELQHFWILIEKIRASSYVHAVRTVCRRGVEPQPCSHDVIDQLLHQRAIFLNQLLSHSQHTADIVRPVVACHVQWSTI